MTMRLGPNNALQPKASPYGLGFPRSLRSLGSAERGRWASQVGAQVFPIEQRRESDSEES